MLCGMWALGVGCGECMLVVYSEGCRAVKVNFSVFGGCCFLLGWVYSREWVCGCDSWACLLFWVVQQVLRVGGDWVIGLCICWVLGCRFVDGVGWFLWIVGG